MGNALYDTDLYAWTRAQAELLRAGRFDELDIEHLAEEIESVGASDRREMRRRMARLIQHMPKYDYRPERRSRARRGRIIRQCSELKDLLADNATLRKALPDHLDPAYRRALLWAENDLPRLPPTCPYTLDHILSGDVGPL